MKIQTNIKQADINITDDKGNVVLAVQVEDYHVVLDTEAALNAIKELIEQAKPLVQ